MAFLSACERELFCLKAHSKPPFGFEQVCTLGRRCLPSPAEHSHAGYICSPPTSRPQTANLAGRRRENGQTRPTGCRAAACFSRRCSSASGLAAHPSHTPPRPS